MVLPFDNNFITVNCDSLLINCDYLYIYILYIYTRQKVAPMIIISRLLVNKIFFLLVFILIRLNYLNEINLNSRYTKNFRNIFSWLNRIAVLLSVNYIKCIKQP